MAELFGFEIKKKSSSDDSKARLQSFAPPEKDDGAVVVQEGGVYGVHLDLDGTVKNDAELITRYREMALQPEIETAIDEIVNEFVAYDSDDDLVELNTEDLDFSDPLKDRFSAEFDVVLELLDFNHTAYEIIKRWYIDGRLYYHVMIDEDNPHDGIQELRYIDPRKIKRVREVAKSPSKNSRDAVLYQDKNEYYLYSDKGFSQKGLGSSQLGQTAQTTSALKIHKDSIIYTNSGLMDANNQTVLSYLHKAIKPLNQLRTLEDATLIYRISRAPERRIFYIDVGNLPKAKAEQYLRDQMVRHKNKLVYDASSGEVRDDRKYMTMLEDFWLPRREGGKGTEISTLPPGQNLGEMDDVLYFQKRLYKALGVPITRLESDSGFNIGKASEITRDELKFSKFVARMRMRFSSLLKEALVRQLVLKKVISPEEADAFKSKVRIDFLRDNYFAELKEAEIMRERIALANEMDAHAGKYFSRDTIKRRALRQTDSEIDEELEKMEEEAEFEAMRQAEMAGDEGDEGDDMGDDAGDDAGDDGAPTPPAKAKNSASDPKADA